MPLLRIPCGKCRAQILFLCQVGRGKGGCRLGSGRTTHSWHDGLSHAPVWTEMNTYRVICHPGDKGEGARWACRARQQRGLVEIASEPARVVLRLGRTWLPTSTGGGIFLFLPWLARVPADGSPGRTDDERVVRYFKLEHFLWKWKVEHLIKTGCTSKKVSYCQLFSVIFSYLESFSVIFIYFQLFLVIFSQTVIQKIYIYIWVIQLSFKNFLMKTKDHSRIHERRYQNFSQDQSHLVRFIPHK